MDAKASLFRSFGHSLRSDGVLDVGDTPLHLAISNGDLETSLTLIYAQKWINEANDRGETPLHIAVRCGNYRLTKMLVGAGAKLDAVNWYGNTPLHDTMRKGRGAYAIANLLIRSGSPLNAQNNNGFTPAACAAIILHLPLLKLLRRSGADFFVKCASGHDALALFHAALLK